MEFRVSSASRNALLQNRTLRLIYWPYYDQESRHETVVIPWATEKVETLCQGFLQTMGCHKDFTFKQNAVHMLPHRDNKVYILFDIFLQDCDQQVRATVNSSFDQPIHAARFRGNLYNITREDALRDEQTARIYRNARRDDKGSRPLFHDDSTSYVNGIRSDKPVIIPDFLKLPYRYVPPERDEENKKFWAAYMAVEAENMETYRATTPPPRSWLLPEVEWREEYRKQKRLQQGRPDGLTANREKEE